MAKAVDSKVVMIGIDAGDIDLIRASLDELPHLKGLLARGACHALRSTADVLTSSVWPTFATGKLPGEHGVYYPMQWDAAAMQLRRVSGDWIQFEPFWNELERDGVRVTVLDMPFSLPSRLTTGVEVQNWGSQECLGPFQSNRPDVARTLRSRFGKHPMGDEVPVEPTVARLEQLRTNLVAGAQKKGEVARWLMANTDWDLFVTVFAESHRGGHNLWPAPEASVPVPDGALRDVYRAIDAAIGHVLEGVEATTTTVVVFSVHGMGPNYTQEHFVPAIVGRINARFRGESVAAEAPPSAKPSLMAKLREAVPGQLQYLLAKALPTAVRDFVVQRAFLGGLDWKTTAGFALPSSGESYLRLNLLGRESQGSSDPNSEAHQRYVKALRDGFLALRETASGARVVRDVVASSTLFPGSRSDLLPDLVVLWDRCLPAASIRSDELGTMTGKLSTGRVGDHRPDGFAIVDGRRHGLDRVPAPAHIVDLAGFARALLRSQSPS